MNNLELLQKEFPKLTWYSEAVNEWKGISGLITLGIYESDKWWVDVYFTNEDLSDKYDLALLFESQVYKSLEEAITGTKEFMTEVSKAITDLI